jgi:hypothetical protein
MTRLYRQSAALTSLTVIWLLAGCAAFPDRLVQPVYHNPFPQLHRVAVLPFYNQSAEPTVDGEEVALAYYNELQAIPGFEVMPVGVAKQLLIASRIEPRTGADFQELARLMNVDAVLVGSITDFSPYYPPRMGLAVDWYAANPGFHPVPAGYGLPWGTADEEYIPSQLVREAEFALAREQLKTQTPPAPEFGHARISQASHETLGEGKSHGAGDAVAGDVAAGAPLPPAWPDPRGFVPPPPSPKRPDLRPQHEPIITHTRIYHGEDAEFTQRLENYFYFRDDARFGGWQGYLQRPPDFIRFCCHMHVTETLAARGGAGESRVVWRWPIGRYER